MGFIYAGYLISQTCVVLMDATRLTIKDEILELKVYKSLKVVNTLASSLKWIFIYYFVIIVRDLKLRLVIEDPREYETKSKRQRIFNNIIFAIFIVSQILLFGLSVLEYLVFPENRET